MLLVFPFPAVASAYPDRSNNRARAYSMGRQLSAIEVWRRIAQGQHRAFSERYELAVVKMFGCCDLRHFSQVIMTPICIHKAVSDLITQRNPTWLVEVSTGSGWRAAGR
jgi:hypothetical protein